MIPWSSLRVNEKNLLPVWFGAGVGGGGVFVSFVLFNLCGIFVVVFVFVVVVVVVFWFVFLFCLFFWFLFLFFCLFVCLFLFLFFWGVFCFVLFCFVLFCFGFFFGGGGFPCPRVPTHNVSNPFSAIFTR